MFVIFLVGLTAQSFGGKFYTFIVYSFCKLQTWEIAIIAEKSNNFVIVKNTDNPFDIHVIINMLQHLKSDWVITDLLRKCSLRKYA